MPQLDTLLKKKKKPSAKARKEEIAPNSTENEPAEATRILIDRADGDVRPWKTLTSTQPANQTEPTTDDAFFPSEEEGRKLRETAEKAANAGVKVVRTDKGEGEDREDDETQIKDSIETHKGLIKDSIETHKGLIKDSQLAYTSENNGHKGLIKDSIETHKGLIKDSIEARELDPSDVVNRLMRLPGLQRRVLEKIHDLAAANGEQTTSPFSFAAMALEVESTRTGVKTSLARMTASGLIIHVAKKRGRGGFVIYRLPIVVFRAIPTAKGLDKGLKKDSQKDSGSPSSSSYNYNKLTTTTGAADDIPTEWRAIDFSVLREMNLHIGGIQSKQFWRAGLDPGAVQQSVFHFAYALQHTDLRQKIRTDPLSYFVGAVLGNGAYAAPQGYAAYRRRVIETVLAQKMEDDRDREQHQERPRELTPDDGSLDEKTAQVLQEQTMKNVT